MAFDAIVVGTGFGGTVAVSRLAEKGKKVLILERGTWWVTSDKLGKPAPSTKKPIPVWAAENHQPLQYWPRPDHRDGLLDLFASMRNRANHEGLYQYSFFRQAHVLTASGVGGGSLIYSNVTLRPNAEVLNGIGLDLGDAEYQAAYAWMEKYRGKLNKVVTKIPLPGRDVSNLGADDYLYLDRSRVLKEAAATVAQKLGIQADWQPLDLSIVEYDPDRGTDSDAAKNHTFCERQGRCIFGCLPAARHTLNKTLYNRFVSDPASGVTLVPMAEARFVRQVQSGYEVTYRDHRDDSDHAVSAPLLFVAAGTLGTTELLLRSRDQGGLTLSKTLGTHFSTNGDFGAFAFNTGKPVHSARGPINTCHVPIKFDGLHFTIEDCAIPALVAAATSTALEVLDNFAQREAFRAKMEFAWAAKQVPDLRDFLPLLPDTHDPTAFQTEAEMVANIFFFNVMGQDDASGVFTLHHDDLDLDWPTPIANRPIWGTIETLLKAFTDAMGGRYIPFPLWKGLGSKKLIVTHPLGGCPIGSNVLDGVLDPLGRPFDGAKPGASTEILPGLYVVDGSAIPGALAANPTLTIAAQALKTVAKALP
jgi:cholesterol oxidase